METVDPEINVWQQVFSKYWLLTILYALTPTLSCACCTVLSIYMMLLADETFIFFCMTAPRVRLLCHRCYLLLTLLIVVLTSQFYLLSYFILKLSSLCYGNNTKILTVLPQYNIVEHPYRYRILYFVNSFRICEMFGDLFYRCGRLLHYFFYFDCTSYKYHYSWRVTIT